MFDYQPTLDGPLVRLRPVRPEDEQRLLELSADPVLWAGLPHLELYLEPKFRAYFQEGLASGQALVATEADTGAVIGWSRYSTEFVEPGEVEIGWTFLGRDYWGGRYNGEMKRLMLAHTFRFVDRVVFRIRENNLRSRRATEKIGGRLLERTAPGGDGPLILYYGIDRGDFAAYP